MNKVINYSRYVLMLSLIGFITCFLISYPYAEHFIIGVQVGAHILTIVFAGVFKVAVVALMAANKELKALDTQSIVRDNYVAT